jgi:phage-related minor tail protein
VPHLDVDWYKTGGIFNAPSLIGVGEAGPEAVLPIEKLKDMLASVLKPQSTAGPSIVINFTGNMSIRDDRDIKKLTNAISKELASQYQAKQRAKGVLGGRVGYAY